MESNMQPLILEESIVLRPTHNLTDRVVSSKAIEAVDEARAIADSLGDKRWSARRP